MALLLVLALAVTPRERFEALVKQQEVQHGGIGSNLEAEKTACKPFVELAQMNPTDPVAFEALSWVIGHVRFVAAADTAMELLARDHAKGGERNRDASSFLASEY